jgi:hypothetical protein
MGARHVRRLLLACTVLCGSLHAADPKLEPKTSVGVSAKSFRRGMDVLAAIERNRLLLKLPAGDVVTAKIVSREKRKK